MPPFFQQKVYEWPDFSGFLCERSHFSDILVYAYIFHSEIFQGCFILLVLHELTDICVITSKKWVQKVKGQYMNRSTFWTIKYMNGSVFSKARYMNGVSFETLARTPVPKLPLSYPPPPAPPPPPRPPPPPHPPERLLSSYLVSLNRFLLRKECFIRKEKNYETFGGTLMYYRDTYETFSGYGIFFPKIRCTGIKRTVRFNDQRLLSRKEGFSLLTVYIVNSC